ncbi:MAG: class I SAM-dependent methyltransferase [Candidatus Paceibacterota bacterium]|jgi:SAM-dependent methyltransferase
MERYNKDKMTVNSKEYDDLLKKEIEIWSRYKGSEDGSGFKERKESAPYQTYRRGTTELMLEYIRKCGNNISVLELGSADGWLTNEIINLSGVKDITSIDISLNDNLEKRYNHKSIVLRGDLNKIDRIKFYQKFDCIITQGTLHHLVDPLNTLRYCIDNLLKEKGVIIINDTWVHQAIQLKTNAFLYSILNRLPHAIFKLNIKELLKILFYRIPCILFSMKFAESVAHSHNTSPFESISSADDYKELYDRKDLEILYFRNFAALPGLQNSWSKSPRIIKDVVQKMDDFLIEKGWFVGDLHICILKKIN